MAYTLATLATCSCPLMIYFDFVRLFQLSYFGAGFFVWSKYTDGFRPFSLHPFYAYHFNKFDVSPTFAPSNRYSNQFIFCKKSTNLSIENPIEKFFHFSKLFTDRHTNFHRSVTCTYDLCKNTLTLKKLNPFEKKRGLIFK